MMSKRKILVPDAREALDAFKGKVMAKAGYITDTEHPDNVKYEVAKELEIPLQKGYNGTLTSTNAGKIGGNIGGNMVREMIKMAQQNLNKQ
jgi:hypothetical protein